MPRRRDLLSAAAIGGIAGLVPQMASAAPRRREAAFTNDLSADDRSVLAGMITRYFQDRARRVTAVSGSAQVDVVAATAGMAQRMSVDASRLDDERRVVTRLHRGYVDSTTSVAVVQARVSSGGAILTVREVTSLRFARPDAKHPRRYGLSHEVIFRRDGSGWRLHSSHHLSADEHTLPVTQFPSWYDDGVAGFDHSLLADRHSKSRGAGAGQVRDPNEYDWLAATNYARKYALNYNPDFRHMKDAQGNGQDCTNFTSQCLLAGKWKPVLGNGQVDRQKSTVWWYNKLGWWATSYTWAAAENWRQFACYGSNPHRTHLITGQNIWYPQWGGIMQMDWPEPNPNGTMDHTMIVVGKTQGSFPHEVWLAGHDNDTDWMPLSEIMSRNKPNTAYYLHWIDDAG